MEGPSLGNVCPGWSNSWLQKVPLPKPWWIAVVRERKLCKPMNALQHPPGVHSCRKETLVDQISSMAAEDVDMDMAAADEVDDGRGSSDSEEDIEMDADSEQQIMHLEEQLSASPHDYDKHVAVSDHRTSSLYLWGTHSQAWVLAHQL